MPAGVLANDAEHCAENVERSAFTLPVSNEAIMSTRSEVSSFVGLWSLLWRSMVFLPFALIRFTLIVAALCSFVWLCVWSVTCAIVHEWLCSALCFAGVLAFVAAARFVRHLSARYSAEHCEADIGGGGYLV